MSKLLSVVLVGFVAGCAAEPGPGPGGADFTQVRRAVNGVPVDGYPSYGERVQLVAINRVRSDPNNPGAGTADECSEHKDPQPPVLYDYDAGQAARFHCDHLMLNQGGLSHNTFCELREDLEATGCDGSAGCSCVSGTECWSCDTLGGCGTGPGGRMTRFGFTGSFHGEVGAAGYGDAWSAVAGWVSENPCDGGTLAHRNQVTGGNSTVVGTGQSNGSGCWNVYYFAEFGSIADLVRPAIASGVHRPESGGATSQFTFYANYYHPDGDPESISVVIDGGCQPLTAELGADGNRTYLYTGDLGGVGCHEYYFLAVDAAGTRVTYPELGSLLVNAGDDCGGEEYVSTQMPANCEDLPCGDGTCDEAAGENCSSCPDDCGRCPCLTGDCGGKKGGCSAAPTPGGGLPLGVLIASDSAGHRAPSSAIVLRSV